MAVVVAGVVALVLVAWLWKRGPDLTAGTRRELGAGGQLQAVGQYRTMLLQATAAVGGVVALAYTARNYRLSRRGQTTDRFTKALEKLGAGDMYVRIGAVYALEQVARDSPELHADIVNVLAAFIRTHTRRTTQIRIRRDATTHHGAHAIALTAVPDQLEHPHEPHADIQTAISMLSRLSGGLTFVDLAGLHLAGVWLDDANLYGATFDDANLYGAGLDLANLEDAMLNRVDLAGASLIKANLAGAVLRSANLTGATLNQVNLTGAVLRGADLSGAALRRANLTDAVFDAANLTSTELNRANLRGAVLRGADLSGATMNQADLTRAEMWGARITAAQMNSAAACDGAMLPAHLAWDPLQDRVREATAEETAAAEQAHRDAIRAARCGCA